MNDVKKNITNWIKEYAKKYNKNLVIGISGGIDSAVTSTLCAETNLKTIVVSMPIHQNNAELIRAQKHMNWLKNNYKNIETIEIDLSIVFDQFKKTIGEISQNKLALANSRARLRMTTLYQIAGYKNGLVICTGNKKEEFCIVIFKKN